ncbi:ppnK [Lepeophtheirus salmonis]|uniref:NAD(+) kinase n=1 Tax=Lepeophtheirus salmonis TaxID=72036 RepID=A0A7R8H2S4_LEPSM|nr:ppnK [Lepeophtheirus salmonis]CAF2819740.1 ppnK [Lepeophtheirus salmonis]
MISLIKIDFIICLGGDGTLLYASSLFQKSVPPVMAFHLGSLGFLTPFEVQEFQEQISDVLKGNAALTLRSRLRCIVISSSNNTSNTTNSSTDYENENNSSTTNLLVLNEVVIDRGASPYLSNIDLYLDGKLITSVQGDGLIISTPTVLPAGVELKVRVSPGSRSTAWMSFDGRGRQELGHGDSLRVTTSIYPVPSICARDQISDWFASLAECLQWNVRKKQRVFDDESVEENDDDEVLDS